VTLEELAGWDDLTESIQWAVEDLMRERPWLTQAQAIGELRWLRVAAV
jgi:hypothetical protein